MFGISRRKIRPPKWPVQFQGDDPFVDEQGQRPDGQIGLAEEIKHFINITGAV